MRYCNHEIFSDGHCGEMSCVNYINKCLRHSHVQGQDDKACNHDKVVVRPV